MIRWILVSLLVLNGAFIFTAGASNENVMKFDTDHDGTLDLAEVQKAAEAKFDAADKDHDGTIDIKEARQFGIKRAEFESTDSDGDKSIDKKEFARLVEERFKLADRDGDGTLSAEELKTSNGKAVLQLLQ
jgi:Ca2+-binding EF-hand superfamily protein